MTASFTDRFDDGADEVAFHVDQIKVLVPVGPLAWFQLKLSVQLPFCRLRYVNSPEHPRKVRVGEGLSGGVLAFMVRLKMDTK